MSWPGWLTLAVLILLALWPSADDREQQRRIDRIWEGIERKEREQMGEFLEKLETTRTCDLEDR